MKYVGIVVVLVLLASLVMEFNSRQADLNRLLAEQNAVTGRLDAKRSTYSALEAQIAYATSDAAVLQWAYDNHMALADDHVVAPMAGVKATATPVPAPVVVETQISNWEKWLMLFFDPTLK